MYKLRKGTTVKPQAVSNFINNSKTTQRVLQGVNNNPAVCTAAASFVFASMMRPALIGVLPFKNEEDKKYSQASAVAAGLVDLAATAAIFIPLNKSIKGASEKLTSDVFQNSKAKEQFKSVTNRSLKLLTLAPISFLRFSLVKPLVKGIFDKRARDKMFDKKRPIYVC